MKKPLSIAILLISISTFAQNIGALEIDERNVSPWIEQELSAYEGVYHFGEGDGSHLVLMINDGAISVQIKQHAYWTEGGYALEAGQAKLSELEIKWEIKNLTGIQISEGSFYSHEFRGAFVRYQDSTGSYQGLKILNPWNRWIGENRYEIGIKISKTLQASFAGTYPETSFRKLTYADIKTLDQASLRLMRNEIYARYGYIFQAGGEMDIYFRKQPWYKSKYARVNPFLTDIELANIVLIRRQEVK